MTTRAMLGFIAAYQSPATSGYWLGSGYRWYLPSLMRFNAPDDWSPFGAGHLNSYTYCRGDPINRSDPSGHFDIPFESIEETSQRLDREIYEGVEPARVNPHGGLVPVQDEFEHQMPIASQNAAGTTRGNLTLRSRNTAVAQRPVRLAPAPAAAETRTLAPVADQAPSTSSHAMAGAAMTAPGTTDDTFDAVYGASISRREKITIEDAEAFYRPHALKMSFEAQRNELALLHELRDRGKRIVDLAEYPRSYNYFTTSDETMGVNISELARRLGFGRARLAVMRDNYWEASRSGGAISSWKYEILWWFGLI